MVAIMILRVERAVGLLMECLHSERPPVLEKKKHQVHQELFTVRSHDIWGGWACNLQRLIK